MFPSGPTASDSGRSGWTVVGAFEVTLRVDGGVDECRFGATRPPVVPTIAAAAHVTSTTTAAMTIHLRRWRRRASRMTNSGSTSSDASLGTTLVMDIMVLLWM